VSAVLDTHSTIWYLHRSTHLSPTALRIIRSAVDTGWPLFISAITLVETIYLAERGRLPLEAWSRLRSEVRSAASSILVQPVDENVAEAIHKVPRDVVPDMPDRIIAATALCLDLPLVTRDRRLQAAGIRTIW
jgi:PIN domain nuclease of toxin-antitoxin system